MFICEEIDTLEANFHVDGMACWMNQRKRAWAIQGVSDLETAAPYCSAISAS